MRPNCTLISCLQTPAWRTWTCGSSKKSPNHLHITHQAFWNTTRLNRRATSSSHWSPTLNPQRSNRASPFLRPSPPPQPQYQHALNQVLPRYVRIRPERKLVMPAKPLPPTFRNANANGPSLVSRRQRNLAQTCHERTNLPRPALSFLTLHPRRCHSHSRWTAGMSSTRVAISP